MTFFTRRALLITICMAAAGLFIFSSPVVQARTPVTAQGPQVQARSKWRTKASALLQRTRARTGSIVRGALKWIVMRPPARRPTRNQMQAVEDHTRRFEAALHGKNPPAPSVNVDRRRPLSRFPSRLSNRLRRQLEQHERTFEAASR
jgi:hypothetical protein